MASFKNFLLKAFKNLCSLFSVTITEMCTFFIKKLEYQSTYLAWERCFYLLSGRHQNVLELLFREPDVDQHSPALLLRFCHKPIRSLEDLRNSLYLSLSVHKIGRAFLIAFSPHALVSLFWGIKFVSSLELHRLQWKISYSVSWPAVKQRILWFLRVLHDVRWLRNICINKTF